MSRRERGGRSLADQLVREGGTGRRPDPLLVLWRWRWEIGLVVAAVAVGRLVDADVLLPAAAVAAVAAALPPLRRLVGNRFCCVATQHLLRAGLRESDVRSWSGRMPAILWTSATPAGERVWLLCPPGVDVARVAAARGELAAACWAAEVAVHRHPRRAAVAVVDVVRRGQADSGGVVGRTPVDTAPSGTASPHAGEVAP